MEKHCAHLQALANAVGRSSGEARTSALADLRKYVHLQCAQKIHQRLNVSMHAATGGTFLDALSAPSEELMGQCPEGLCWSESEVASVPAKVWRREETRMRQIATTIVKHEFALDDRKHIVVDKDSFRHYHDFVSRVLQRFDGCLQRLLQTAGGLELEEASELLTMLAKAGNILCDLAHRSPSFRRYISTNAVVKRIESVADSGGRTLAKVPLLQIPDQSLKTLTVRRKSENISKTKKSSTGVGVSMQRRQS